MLFRIGLIHVIIVIIVIIHETMVHLKEKKKKINHSMVANTDGIHADILHGSLFYLFILY